MKVEIIQEGRVLRQYNHKGRFYAEAPPQGAYEIRLTNDSTRRNLAVVSVDGVNIVTGDDAGVDGPGYVMRQWETLTIPGWRRDDGKVAKFTFQPQEGSYVNRTGRGTKNTGVIGVAVFEEKVSPLFHVETTVTRTILRGRGLTKGGDDSFSDTAEVYSSNAVHDGSEASCLTVPCSASAAGEARLNFDGLHHETTRGGGGKKRRRVSKGATKSAEPVQLGTGYGKEAAFHTETTTFDRASNTPNLIIQVQYAVRGQLIKWGVPVTEDPPSPSAFPASSPSVAPPPGWQADR